MRKFILEISKYETNVSVHIRPHNIQSPFVTQLCRQSPIYSVSKTPVDLNLQSPEESYLLFCFTFKSFETIGRLLRVHENEFIANRIFVTHGIASIVIIAPTRSSIQDYLSSIDELIIGYEFWVVKEGLVINEVNNILSRFPRKEHIECHVGSDKLSIESQNVFKNISLSLGYAYTLASFYAKDYLPLFDNVFSISKEIVLKLLFFEGKIEETELKNNLITNNPEWEEADIEKQLQNNIFAKNNKRERIIRIHQLKDESIQLSAILQNVIRQGFSCVCPILSSSFESGEYSLLGIGGGFSALVAINTHIRKGFSVCSDVEGIAEYFKDNLPSPTLPDPSNLVLWRNKLSEFKGISKAIPFCKRSEQVSHMVYFSNRLGFRETKYSIATAMQAVTFSSLPSWNMCTVFHEYMHAHVRGLFSQLYPFKSLNNTKSFDKAFEKYKKRTNRDESCDNLLEFIQTCFMSVASDLSESANISHSISKDEISKSIRDWHDSLNEIIVHILDYTYFYEFNNETYIKGIWSSWVSLPFIYSRISEYLLRTICAVASNESGKEEDIFNASVDIVRANLISLRKFPHIDTLLLQEAIDHLDKTDEISIQFYHLYPIIYVVKHLLISSQIKEAFVDPDAASVDEEEEDIYSLELTPGVFEDRSIKSPISFLQDYLRYTFQTEVSDSMNDVEYISLWILSVLASTLSSE